VTLWEVTLRACSEEFRPEAYDGEVMRDPWDGMLEPTGLHRIPNNDLP
jgi:hypothetical protein